MLPVFFETDGRAKEPQGLLGDVVRIFVSAPFEKSGDEVAQFGGAVLAHRALRSLADYGEGGEGQGSGSQCDGHPIDGRDLRPADPQ